MANYAYIRFYAVFLYIRFNSVAGSVRDRHSARMVVTGSNDAGKRDSRQLRSIVHGRGHGKFVVRGWRGNRRRAGRCRIHGVRAPRVTHRQRGARVFRVANGYVPEGQAHAVRGTDTPGRRVRCYGYYNTHVRRRDSGTRNTRFL